MITYTDKVQVSVNPIAPEEQWMAVDANEVKNEVNANITATAAAQAAADAAQSAADTAGSAAAAAQATADAAQTAAEVITAINATIGTATQTALNLKSDSYFTYYTKTGSYTLLAADRTDVIAGKRLLFIMDSASAMNFTVPPDATVDFPIGTDIKIIRIGVGVVTFVGASPPTINGSAGDLIDSGSYAIMSLVKTAANSWVLQNGSTAGKYVDYTVTFGGFSVAPTAVVSRFTLIKHMCELFIKCGGAGTSNSTTFTMTIPFAPKTSTAAPIFFHESGGATQTVVGRALFTAGSTTISLQRTLDGTAYSATLGKRADVSMTYEINN